MIRKYIFRLAFVGSFFTAPLIKAQDCTPEALTVPSISPSELPWAVVGASYSETISVLLFADTMVERQGQQVKAVMDSMIILGINGLPNGINFKLKDNNPKFLPLKPSCMSIYGTPDSLGIYPLEIPIRSHAKVLGFVPITQLDTIRDYVMNVVEEGASLVKLSRLQLAVFPNPAQQNVSVIATQVPKIWNSNGIEMKLTWEHNGRVYTAKLDDVSPGLYLVSADGRHSRFVKQ